MATPNPFFFPTTIPAYASAAAYPAPLLGFEPPAYGHHICPSAATYSTSPFPFLYSAPAAYTYPPPASAYTTTSSFSPNVPTWPPPSPDSTPSILSPTPTTAQQWVASTTSAAPDPWAKQNGDLFSTKATSNNRSFMGSSSPASASDLPATAASHAPSTRLDPQLLSDFVLQLELARRSLVDMSRRLDEHLAQSKRSIASMKSGIPKLVDMVPTSESSTRTTPTQSVGFTPSSAGTIVEPAMSELSKIDAAEISPVSSSSSSFGGFFIVPKTASASIVPAALAYVAPQVIDKMPPPRFGCENYCTGHPNSIQSSCVQGGSTNISEQNLHGRPQQYGFHDLNRQSVFRADGSEHSYLALPDDYPLELASPEPVFDVYDDDTDGCSTEFVDVLSGTPKQQSHEEEQQDSEQLPKCVRQVPEVEQTTTLNYISDVVGFTHELQQQDDERAGNYSVLKASNSFLTRSSQLTPEHSMRELRLLWDPGALAFLVTLLKNRSTALTALFVIALRGVFEEVMLDIPPAKPPDKYGTVYSSPQVIQLKVLKAENPSAHTHLNFLSCNSKQLSDIQSNCSSLESITSWQRGAFSLGNFAISALWRNITLSGDKIFRDQILAANCHHLFPYLSTSDTSHICIFVKLWSWNVISAQPILDSSMKKGTFFSSGHILPLNPRYAVLLLHYFLWEFLMDRVLRNSGVLNLMDLKHFWAQLMLQYHSWCTTPTAYPQVHYCCLPIVLDCPYSETVQRLVCYSGMFCSSEAIPSKTCLSTGNLVHMIPVLNSGKIAQEGSDAAAFYQVLKIQLPMSNTSHIWDPGIASILLLHKVHDILLVHYSAIHACYFVSAHLPPAQITAYVSTKIELAELSSSCMIFHQHQITNWTSTTSNAIRSFEYGYNRDCPNGQWEFFHQEGVQKNYNAQNLVSSHNYLQIWKMDIIFITYLPP